MLLKSVQFEQLAEIHKVELVFVCEAQVVFRAGYVIKQVLDVLVVLACLQTRLVVDDDLDLRRVTTMLLTLGLVDVNSTEDFLAQIICKPLADLYQLIRVCIH